MFSFSKERMWLRGISTGCALLLVAGMLMHYGALSASPAASLEAVAWSGWYSLGKPTGGTVEWPVIGQNQDGRLEIFAQVRGLGSWPYLSIYQIFQWLPGTWFLSNWNALGSSDAQAAPSVGWNQDGRLEVFAQSLKVAKGGPCPGPHYDIEHIGQTAINNGWNSWASMETISASSCIDANGPYAGRNQDGRLEIFVKGSDGNVWRKAQVAANGSWGSWSSMGMPGGISIDPILCASRQQNGSQAIFVRGSNYEIYLNYQTAPNGGWSGWVGMGKPNGVRLGSPVVSQNQDGRLELFASGDDGGIWHKWQVAPNSFWSGWASLGTVLFTSFSGSDPVVGLQSSGRMALFVLGSDGLLWHIVQTAPSSSWGLWSNLGKPAGASLTNQLAVARNLDGSLEIFAVGSDGALHHNLETASRVFLPVMTR